MTKSITSQLSDNAIYQILEIIASEIDNIDDKELSITLEDQMKSLTYSDSPFYSNWSQTYFTNLTLDQHIVNNEWLMNTLTMLKEDGELYVPCLNKSFNRLGEEIV